MSDTTAPEITVAEIIDSLVETAFGTDETVTPYKIASVINGVFKATGTDKKIPPQMMYNYDRNGLIAKGRKNVKAYDKDEVKAYVTKYTTKHIEA